jgi:hypothetical protein
MVSYWEKRREQEEKEAREKELNNLVRLDFDEEAEEYNLMKKEVCHSKVQ